MLCQSSCGSSNSNQILIFLCLLLAKKYQLLIAGTIVFRAQPGSLLIRPKADALPSVSHTDAMFMLSNFVACFAMKLIGVCNIL